MVCHTIGYGNRSFEEFSDLLRNYKISHLVDVRSYPDSGRDDFNSERLATELPKRELKYISCPQLGGIRKIPYHEFMKSAEFENSISRLQSLIKRIENDNSGIVLMCAEKKPRNCHRHYIAQELEKRGVRVIHIIEPGQTSLIF